MHNLAAKLVNFSDMCKYKSEFLSRIFIFLVRLPIIPPVSNALEGIEIFIITAIRRFNFSDDVSDRIRYCPPPISP